MRGGSEGISTLRRLQTPDRPKKSLERTGENDDFVFFKLRNFAQSNTDFLTDENSLSLSSKIEKLQSAPSLSVAQTCVCRSARRTAVLCARDPPPPTKPRTTASTRCTARSTECSDNLGGFSVKVIVNHRHCRHCPSRVSYFLHREREWDDGGLVGYTLKPCNSLHGKSHNYY